ncbi:MAG: MBL fold metallo-hydrolase [Chloroflexota bacterium]
MKNNRLYLILLLIVLFLVACSSNEAPSADVSESIDAAPTEVIVGEATEEVVEEEAVVQVEAETVEAEIVGIPEPTMSEDPSGATLYVYDFGAMMLHAFVNPPQGVGNGTYIIESENSLVLIDSHFSADSAEAFRAYADSLGKPIDRIYATHEHPDHINGLKTAFADIESYAPEEVIQLAAEAGIDIDNTVEVGQTNIDGITYEFDIFADAESEEALIIKLPEYDVIATGDLIYNNYHMVMNPNIPNWLDQLDQLAALSDYQLILPGHGEPTDPSVYAASSDYLETALSLYNEIDDPDEFQEALINAYPDHRAPFFLGLAAERMYPKSEDTSASTDDAVDEAEESVVEATAEPEPTPPLHPAEALIVSFTEPSQTTGETLVLYGQVVDVNGEAIPDAVVEIWQTDASGVYDHPDDSTTADRDPTFQFFGATTVETDGWYAFRTILPGEYNPRPRHIHYKVKQNESTLLTSQFYFSEDIEQVQGESMFQAIGDSGDLLLLQLIEGDGLLLAQGQIVIDTGIGTGELPLTPSQAEGPFYPVVALADYDNDLTILSTP